MAFGAAAEEFLGGRLDYLHSVSFSSYEIAAWRNNFKPYRPEASSGHSCSFALECLYLCHGGLVDVVDREYTST